MFEKGLLFSWLVRSGEFRYQVGSGIFEKVGHRDGQGGSDILDGFHIQLVAAVFVTLHLLVGDVQDFGQSFL